MGIVMTPRFLQLLVLILCLPLGGCSLLGLGPQVRARHVAAKPPADITAYVSVVDGDTPVSYLDASNFQISENGVVLDPSETGLRLLPRDSIAVGVTVLLLDLSGSPDEKALARIERGAATFVEKVTSTQPVIVLAFDGSSRPREVTRFGKVEREVKRPLPPLKPFLSDDSSRDLHGAVLSAITGLKKALKKEKKEVRYGTIVTVLRGPDLAGRRTLDEVEAAAEESGFDYFSVSPVEPEIEGVGVIGRDLQFEFKSLDSLPMRLQDAGMRVRNGWFSNYLISYCSPARAGNRELGIEVTFEGVTGGKKTGTDSAEFEAKSFTGGCKVKTGGPPAIVNAPPTSSVEKTEPSQSDEAVDHAPRKKKRVAQRKRPKSTKKPQPAETHADESDEEEDDGEIVAPPTSGKYE